MKSNLKILTLLLVSFLGILKIISEDKIYATGDAVEYTIMTEAFYNHFSPDVRSGDFDSFKKAYCKINKWEENNFAVNYDNAKEFVSERNHKKLEFKYAFVVDKDGEKHSCHFFVYSLINLPVRFICSVIPFNPLLISQITNLLLIIITGFFIFKYSQFKEFETILFVLLFFFSTNYWYLTWQHTEVFTVCFATLGLWLFLSGKNYIGILLISVAAMQNQPISLLVGALTIITLFQRTINFRNIIKLGGASVLVLFPTLFYYYHFGETNLIKIQGVLSFDYVNFTRVFGFFFDINQGVILAIPLVLLVYLTLLIRKLFLIKSEKNIWEFVIPMALISAVCAASTIDNWNHGQAYVNRYVTYISALILVHTFYLVLKINNFRIRKSLLIVLLISQIGTVIYHQSLVNSCLSTNKPKPISNWVLEHLPGMYNPDPIIFISRYSPGAIFDFSLSPIYYMKANGDITKFLVHQEYMNNLEEFGFNKYQIDSLSSNLKFENRWAYITVDEKLRKSLFPSSKIKQIDVDRKIKAQIKTIINNPDWYSKIKLQAQSIGISEDEALRNNAAFVLKVDIQSNETKEEKIRRKINEIRNSPDWLILMEKKSKAKNISLDSIIYYDAKWTVENEIK